MTPVEALPGYAATPGGFLLVLAIILPVLAVLAILASGPRHAPLISLLTVAGGSAVAVALLMALVDSGKPVVHIIGGWSPPLGLALRADGFSGVMILTSSVVIAVVGLYAYAQTRTSPRSERSTTTFWALLMTIWSGLAAVFVGNDLFNLYVALELLTFAAVPLVSLDGRSETTAAAFQYLIFAMVGSLLYLLGAGLIYAACGTLDLSLIAHAKPEGSTLAVALSLMIAGLLAKAALFPLHIWLPPAHAGAKAPASAILSALVVKAPFFLILRLVVEVASPEAAALIGRGLAVLGSLSILVCSILALQQSRLKLMIAYSTVAQIGYLFIVFDVASGSDGGAANGSLALTGGALQLVSHALAKAAMFLAAGVVAEAYGHDRIDELQGFGRRFPLTAATIILAGLSLVGIPPTGGFVAKYLLLTAAVASGDFWLALVMTLGGLIAAAYVFRLVSQALAEPVGAVCSTSPSWQHMERAAFFLALLSLGVGFIAPQFPAVLLIGRSSAVGGVMP